MFHKILISNRGEIACRIIRTCRRLGIATVAVYSEADRNALHTHEADEAVCIGAAEASASYLNVDRIIDAATNLKADAIHPGYGFLSENTHFAKRCHEVGLVFIGPSVKTIELMGSKSAAKHLMESVGVPTLPGYHGDDQDDDTLLSAAHRVGFPVMLKASAGGGGKGMRIVENEDQFASALISARREAAGAFGDDKMLIERYIVEPRHIEVQIFGDNAGEHVHLFERECSIQRRHQKVIEESPSPFIDAQQRLQIAKIALDAAKAVNYVNAGTVEFIVDAKRQFFFMEMNTRLQVEHPVTEMVTGHDLVEWQIRIASGEPIPVKQSEITCNGHAIEARIYAENPYQDYLPSTGVIERFAHPELNDHLRVDSGIRDGDIVGIHYDPMLAKMVVWDTDREVAIAKLKNALGRTAVFGMTTNVPLLREIATHPAFAKADIDTGFLDRHGAELTGAIRKPSALALAAAAVRVMLDRQVAADITRSLYSPEPGSPWDCNDGWQVNGLTGNRLLFTNLAAEQYAVRISGWDGHYAIELPENTVITLDVEVIDQVVLELKTGSDSRRVVVLRYDCHQLVTTESESVELTLGEPYPQAAAARDEDAHPGSPLPGRIVAIHVEEGSRVEQGDPLLVLEGMKMEYTLKARAAGVVQQLHAKAGDMVEAEVPLIDIVPDSKDTGT